MGVGAEQGFFLSPGPSKNLAGAGMCLRVPGKLAHLCFPYCMCPAGAMLVGEVTQRWTPCCLILFF